jgi:RND superfamily putative drug exporter
MARLARIVSGRRSRWACLAVWLVLIVVFAPLGSKINNVTNEDIALPGGSQSKQVQDLLRDRFAAGDTRTAVLVYQHAGGLTDRDKTKIATDARGATARCCSRWCRSSPSASATPSRRGSSTCSRSTP